MSQFNSFPNKPGNENPKANFEQKASISSISSSLATDSSSLVDLKAEVFRKQQEASFNKLHGGALKLKVREKGKSNKDKIWSKQNAGLTSREKRDIDVEDERQKRISSALEDKAKLYDKLSSGEINNDGRYLVNFNKNDNACSSDEDNFDYNIDQPMNEGENWVEYKDALGRTRMAMRKDLPELISRDKKLNITSNSESNKTSIDNLNSNNASETEDKTLLSEDMRRELLRQKWEKEEEENLKKTKLHYKDVLFDEARTHGAAFYNFSRNEAERASEMENLQEMHKETERAREARNDINAKRKSAMEIRLKKVRDRKRLKLGLPIRDNEEILSNPIIEDITDKPKEISLEATVMESLKKLREEHTSDTLKKDSQRKQTIREWDLGKEGVDNLPINHSVNKAFDKGRPIDKPVLSQSEWVSEKRQLRNTEFAPPANYEKSRKNKNDFDSSQNNLLKNPKLNRGSFDPNQVKKFPNGAGHDTTTSEAKSTRVFDNGLPQWKPDLVQETNPKKNKFETKSSKNLDELEMMDKNRLSSIESLQKEDNDVKSKWNLDAPNNHISSMLIETLNDQPTLSLNKRLMLHRDMMNNYGGTSTLGKKGRLSNAPSRSGLANITTDMHHQSYEDVYQRNKGVEIEPPAAMDYYNTQQNNSKFNYKLSGKKNSSLDSMKESLRIGNAKNVSNSKQNRKTEASLLNESDSD